MCLYVGDGDIQLFETDLIHKENVFLLQNLIEKQPAKTEMCTYV